MDLDMSGGIAEKVFTIAWNVITSLTFHSTFAKQSLVVELKTSIVYFTRRLRHRRNVRRRIRNDNFNGLFIQSILGNISKRRKSFVLLVVNQIKCQGF